MHLDKPFDSVTPAEYSNVACVPSSPPSWREEICSSDSFPLSNGEPTLEMVVWLGSRSGPPRQLFAVTLLLQDDLCLAFAS